MTLEVDPPTLDELRLAAYGPEPPIGAAITFPVRGGTRYWAEHQPGGWRIIGRETLTSGLPWPLYSWSQLTWHMEHHGARPSDVTSTVDVSDPVPGPNVGRYVPPLRSGFDAYEAGLYGGVSC